MALGNLPGIPQQYIPRFRQLLQKLNSHDLTFTEISNNIMSALGRVRIDAEGITLAGTFGRTGAGPSELRAMVESILNLIDYLPILKDKELLVKKEGNITKIKLGLPVNIIPSGVWELEDEKIPVIEIIDGVKAMASILSYIIGDLDEVIDLQEKGFKIYRFEDMVGWTPDWQWFAKLINIVVPALSLTTREVTDSVGGPAADLWDDILKRCGV